MEENKTTHFPTGKREIILLVCLALCGIFMADFILNGGFNAPFALMTMAISSLSFFYLRRSGCRGGWYANALFALSLVIGGSFLRSDDGFVKLVMLLFLMTAGNLSLVLLAGQSHRKPGGLLSLLDAPMAVFTFGFGQLGNAFGGLNDARKNAGTAGKRNIAVLTGLAVSLPVLAMLIPLLIKADAAFEGLVGLLPEMNWGEPVMAVIFGLPMACLIYARNTGLKYCPKEEREAWTPRYFSAWTVNTLLISVCLLYLAYLVSQLAYFVGGFSGILPEEFTMAEFARRGFFEMTWLAAINLGLIVLSVAFTEQKEGQVPLFTRGLCTFIGVMTLFFTVTASAKMILYIGSYGLTRLRLLVQVIIIFIAMTVIFVAVWLFKPKFAYMKAVILTALLIGAAVAWADVDTVVASYNFNAYRSGRLETLDMDHFRELGDGAVPYLEELTRDDSRTVANGALAELNHRARVRYHDIRSWNIASGKAWEILKDYYVETENSQITDTESPLMNLAYDTETVSDAKDLTKHYCKLPREEEYWCLYLDRGLLLWEDGSETEICLGAATHYVLDQAGVDRLWVSDCYVVFWQADGHTAMVWTAAPNAATWRLEEQFGEIAMTPVADQWYLVRL